MIQPTNVREGTLADGRSKAASGIGPPRACVLVALVISFALCLTIWVRGIAVQSQFKTMIQRGDTRAVAELLKRNPQLLEADLGGRPGDKLSPLGLASGLGQLEVCRILLSNGANLESKDKYGLTPLHRAAEHEQTNIVFYLLDLGANPETQDAQGHRLIEDLPSGAIRSALETHAMKGPNH